MLVRLNVRIDVELDVEVDERSLIEAGDVDSEDEVEQLVLDEVDRALQRRASLPDYIGELLQHEYLGYYIKHVSGATFIQVF